MGYIYKITNKVNNKSYIGQTINSVNRRWIEHKRDTKSNKDDFYLHRAMRKYGVDNFSISIVEEVENKLLNERESFWINFFNTFECGYNLTTGGGQNTKISEDTKKKISENTRGSRNPMYGKTHSTEARAKISKAHKGKTLTEEQKLQMSFARKGDKAYWYGKHLPEETREKLRQANIGKKHTEESKLKMSLSRSGEKHHNFGKRGKDSTRHTTIYMCSKDGELLNKFDTLAETLKFLGLKGHSDLYKSIKNKTLYKGYYWSKKSVETIETTVDKKL